MSRLKTQPFGLVLVAALLVLGVACGLFVLPHPAHSSQAGPACLFFTSPEGGSTARALFSTTPSPSAGAVFFLAVALASASLFYHSRYQTVRSLRALPRQSRLARYGACAYNP